MKIAIIGAGTMGMTYAHNLVKMEGVQIVGACDADLQRAEKMAQVCQTRAYTEAGEMIGQEQPDVVCICLPTFLHMSFVVKLAEKGIHIICEKPMALSLEEAKKMQDVCEQHKVRLFIGHVVRFFPNYRDAVNKVRSGTIGNARIGHFKRFGSFPLGVDNWYHDRTKSGGVILDLMIHDIDISREIFGEVESVYASSSYSAQDELEYAQVTLKFENKSIANLTGYWGYPGPFTTSFEIAGDKGTIRFNSNEVQSLDLKVNESESESESEGEVKAVQVPQSPMIHNPYYYELEHFIQCIRNGSTPIVTATDAYKALAIALAAEQSARLKQPVRMEEML